MELSKFWIKSHAFLRGHFFTNKLHKLTFFTVYQDFLTKKLAGTGASCVNSDLLKQRNCNKLY